MRLIRGRTNLPFASAWVHPRILVGSVLIIVLVVCIVFLVLYSIDYILLFRATWLLAHDILHPDCPFIRISSPIVCFFKSIVGFRKQYNEQVSKYIYLFLHDYLILMFGIFYLLCLIPSIIPSLDHLHP